MKISSLGIKHFKSISELNMEDVNSAVILVGKNNTGKTVITEAILLAMGLYQVKLTDFGAVNRNIEIFMKLEINEEDLLSLQQRGIVSSHQEFNDWKQEFGEKLPSYVDGNLSFTCIVSKNGKIQYADGIKKHNPYIHQVFPKIHYIDDSRNPEEIQRDIFFAGGQQVLANLRENKCVFENSKVCDHCFQCMELINQKKPEELTIFETTKLLEYKLYNLNMNELSEKFNYYFHKNGGGAQSVNYMVDFNIDEVFKIKPVVINNHKQTEMDISTLSTGIKSIYILSLLEAYAETSTSIPSIIIMEDPETYLHPQLQKVASEILYKLSKKNQVIFTTHSPSMIFNFTSKQIKQIVLDENYYTIAKEDPDIDEILEDLGYSAGDLMNVSFVFIVEGKQDSNRLPLLLEKYYSEIYDEEGMLQRISIVPVNSCTNIQTYANLKYINKLYLKDQFLMIRDSDGKNPKYLVKQLCNYYAARAKEDVGNIPKVEPKNVLVLKYYSFENYFLDPKVMEKIGIIKEEEDFYNILYDKYKAYLYKLPSMRRLVRRKGLRIKSKEDIRNNMEDIKIYVRGHNLYDIFYKKFKGEHELEILKKYIDAAPRETFENILEAIDNFVYFESRRKN